MLDQSLVLPLVEVAFGRWAMVVPDEEWLRRAAIDHEPTLEFLRTIGLPLQCPIWSAEPALTEPPETLSDLLSRPDAREEPDPEFLARYGGLVWIGYGAADEAVYLDPHTGIVHGLADYASAPFVYNSSVSHVVYFAAYFEIHRKIDGLTLDDMVGEDLADEAFAAAEAISSHFAEIDPAACEPPDDNLWTDVLVDGFAAGIFLEWAWDRSSVEYFVSRGINPTVLQPRRPLEKYVINPWSDPGPAAILLVGGTFGPPSFDINH